MRDDETSTGRRTLLKALIGLGGGLIAALVAVPGVGAMIDPLLRRRASGGDFVPVGDASALDASGPVALQVIGERVDAWTRSPGVLLGTVWVQRRGDGELLAFTAECPHLGCRIGYDDDEQKFSCPCHESRFGLDGGVESGPSPRAMDTLEARVRDGQVEVRFKRFRTQTDERSEIG